MVTTTFFSSYLFLNGLRVSSILPSWNTENGGGGLMSIILPNLKHSSIFRFRFRFQFWFRISGFSIRPFQNFWTNNNNSNKKKLWKYAKIHTVFDVDELSFMEFSLYSDHERKSSKLANWNCVKWRYWHTAGKTGALPIDKRLTSIKVPDLLPRKPRSLSDRAHWKGTRKLLISVVFYITHSHRLHCHYITLINREWGQWPNGRG